MENNMSKLPNPKHEKIAWNLAAGLSNEEAVEKALPGVKPGSRRFKIWVNQLNDGLYEDITARVDELTKDLEPEEVQVAEVVVEEPAPAPKKKAPAKKAPTKKA